MLTVPLTKSVEKFACSPYKMVLVIHRSLFRWNTPRFPWQPDPSLHSPIAGVPSDDVNEVVVNGCHVHVRQNLWLFLDNFRAHAGEPRSKLWIDYLCVDQSNQKERGHQVRLMKDVSSSADTVYAWLGEATPDTDIAIDYINLVRHVPRKGRTKLISRAVETKGIRALRTLVYREYWSRLWIIQELVLSQRLRLMISDKVVPWEDLEAATTALMVPDRDRHKARSNQRSTAARQNFRHIWELRRARVRRARGGVGLRRLLERVRHAEYMDPRDRIYGLLGLATPFDRGRAVIDYNSSVIEACFANMGVIFKTSHSIHRWIFPVYGNYYYGSSVPAIAASS